MANKKSVGGKVITVTANTELITWGSCGFTEPVDVINISAFYFKNEDDKDIIVVVNGGSDTLVKPGESLDYSKITDIDSFIVKTASIVRWGGVR